MVVYGYQLTDKSIKMSQVFQHTTGVILSGEMRAGMARSRRAFCILYSVSYNLHSATSQKVPQRARPPHNQAFGKTQGVSVFFDTTGVTLSEEMRVGMAWSRRAFCMIHQAVTFHILADRKRSLSTPDLHTTKLSG